MINLIDNTTNNVNCTAKENLYRTGILIVSGKPNKKVKALL